MRTKVGCRGLRSPERRGSVVTNTYLRRDFLKLGLFAAGLALTKKINEVLKKMEDDGSMEELKKKWFGDMADSI